MREMPNLMETELETFGASTIEDFTWKQLFDTDACTICGRCTSVCPAHATGKPLDPREIVLKIGEVMARSGSPAVSPPVGVDRRSPSPPTPVRADHGRRALVLHHRARRATRSARSTSRSSTRSSTCAATSRSWRATSPSSSATCTARWRTAGNVYGMNQGERGDWVGALEGVEIVEPRRGLRPRVPLLGRLRGFLRRPQQEDQPRRGDAAAAGGHRLRDSRAERDVHRRLCPPVGQRVPLPDARDAEHRDARRARREEDHHAVPALLQHPEERVPAARRPLRGDPPLAAAHRSSSTTDGCRWRVPRSTSG